MYIINLVPKELKETYNQKRESYVTDEQYDIISFSFTKQRKTNFTWRPIIFDIFVNWYAEKDNTTIAAIAASTISVEYFNNTENCSTMDWHFLQYSTIRYIIFDNDYKKCIDIILEKAFFGENIYGIKDASKYFFEKEPQNLSTEELVSLIVSLRSPVRYKIGTEENKREVLEIINEHPNS
jgi:hypothetical protein